MNILNILTDKTMNKSQRCFIALDGARKLEGVDRLGRGRLRQLDGGDALQVHPVVRRTIAW
jgi:hypothetical protein